MVCDRYRMCSSNIELATIDLVWVASRGGTCMTFKMKTLSTLSYHHMSSFVLITIRYEVVKNKHLRNFCFPSLYALVCDTLEM